MNARQARNVLRAYRPSGEDDHERDVREAVKFAAKHPALESDFHNQLAFDRALAIRKSSGARDASMVREEPPTYGAEETSSR